MEGETVAEAFDVVESLSRGGVGRVEPDAEVEAQHQEVEVVAQAGAGAQGDVAERARRELAVGARRVVAQQPYVAGVEEYRAVQAAEEAGPQLQVGLELEVARLVDVGVLLVLAMVGARPDGAHGEGAYAVGAAGVELVGVRRVEAVAVAVDGAGEEARGQFEAVARQAEGFVRLGRYLDKLRERTAEEILVARGEGAASGGIEPRHHVAGLLGCELQPQGLRCEAAAV